MAIVNAIGQICFLAMINSICFFFKLLTLKFVKVCPERSYGKSDRNVHFSLCPTQMDQNCPCPCVLENKKAFASIHGKLVTVNFILFVSFGYFNHFFVTYNEVNTQQVVSHRHVSPSVLPSVLLIVCLSVCLSVGPSICPSNCLSVCLSENMFIA